MGLSISGARTAEFEPVYAYFPILKERRRQAAGTLSGGQQQQLAIGRVLVGQPTLLLLDEPSEGIQPSHRAGHRARRRRTEPKTGLTVVLVEQNIDMIRAMAQRCYVMDKGRVVAELRPPCSTTAKSSAAISPSENTSKRRNANVLVRKIHHGQNGVANGKPGAKHTITEAEQGKYHYAYGPLPSPRSPWIPARSFPARRMMRSRARSARNRQAQREAQLSVPQSAERPDLRQWRREGRHVSRSTSRRSFRAARSRSAPPR